MIFGALRRIFLQSISTINVPKDVDKTGLCFFCYTIHQFYWVLGATLGASLFGSFIKFNTDGLDFVMTALFVVIFIEQWMKKKNI